MEALATEFWVKYGKILYDGSMFDGWAIFGPGPDGKTACLSRIDFKKPLRFATRQDAQLAIDAMARAGLTSFEKVKEVDRSVIVQICCEALLW